MGSYFDTVTLIPMHAITITIDGGGAVPATGVKGRWSAPNDCVITSWVLLSDTAGDAVIDILRSTYNAFPNTVSIAGANKPTLTAAQKNWDAGPLADLGSANILEYDILEFNLTSVATCKLLTLTLTLAVNQ